MIEHQEAQRIAGDLSRPDRSMSKTVKPLRSGALSASADCMRCANHWTAFNARPWLAVAFDKSLLATGWIEILYKASFLDPLVRPVLRIRTAHGLEETLMPAPLFGRAAWVGNVPRDTQQIEICPVDRPGIFGFEIEAVRPLAYASVVGRSLKADVSRGLRSFGARAIRLDRAAGKELRLALTATAMSQYHDWRAERLRTFEPEGVDAARSDWLRTPAFRFIVTVRPGADALLAGLLNGLRTQPYPRWSLAIVGAKQALQKHVPSWAMKEHRVVFYDADADLQSLRADLNPNTLVANIEAGDRIAEYALACLAEAAVAAPSKILFYGDEDRIDAKGHHVRPRLKPDWSPILEAHAPYLSAAVFMRASIFAHAPASMRIADLADATHSFSFAQRFGENDVCHIRRVLLSRQAGGRSAAQRRTVTKKAPLAPAKVATTPEATIIIPNKDRLDLLRTCIESMRTFGGNIDYEVIVVDNGSLKPTTGRYYRELQADRRFRTIERPGEFNFSWLCNEGAALARSQALVFLNNDTEIVSTGWLRSLSDWCRHVDVGAVGAKLLYATGRVQHAGVILGMDDIVGHIGLNADHRAMGYLRRFTVPHELSAVTGACFAIEKTKFDAVGGFDAKNVPVQLSDIDLCMRLAERGWKSVMVPDVLLLHHESATRGRVSRPDKVFAGARSYFTRRWAIELRDDPYFHPALSLDSVTTALG